MNLVKVTITGADDSINPSDLTNLNKEFPFVEWGILLSKSSQGSKRFPSFSWIDSLYKEFGKEDPNLCGHICGQWTKDICKGNIEFILDKPTLGFIFQRFQLNFHSILHKIDKYSFINGLKRLGRQIIFQLEDVNNEILDFAQADGIDAVPLFDLSGGIGTLPESWPKARKGFCGYAGGLSPDNLREQLDKISKVCGSDPIWIDVETHVRSNNDYQFDLDKVQKFLEISKDYITK